MKKANVIIALAATAGVNPFLDADKHLNIGKIQALQAKVEALEADFPTENEKGRAIKPPKPVQTFMISRKAKPAKISASLQKKGDLKYLTQRAIKVGSLKRVTDRALVRNMKLLTVYEPAVLGKVLAPQVKQAAAAIVRHQAMALKTKTNVTKVRTQTRDAANKVFDASTAKLMAILTAGGIKDTMVTMSKGMGGVAMLVNLGGGNVVSIGKSDDAKFRAAKKAAAAAAVAE